MDDNVLDVRWVHLATDADTRFNLFHEVRDFTQESDFAHWCGFEGILDMCDAVGLDQVIGLWVPTVNEATDLPFEVRGVPAIASKEPVFGPFLMVHRGQWIIKSLTNVYVCHDWHRAYLSRKQFRELRRPLTF